MNRDCRSIPRIGALDLKTGKCSNALPMDASVLQGRASALREPSMHVGFGGQELEAVSAKGTELTMEDHTSKQGSTAD